MLMAAEDRFEAKVQAIGSISSLFTRKNGTPRQPTICPESKAVLTIDRRVFNNPDHALQGLEEYTHIWIIYYFHQNQNKRFFAKVHPPRLNGKACGVFASRSPHRPNPIGLTLAKIDKIEGGNIHLSGIDMVDGTPVLDIKPFIKTYDIPNDLNKNESALTGAKEVPKWVLGSEVPDSQVLFTERSLKDLCKFHSFAAHKNMPTEDVEQRCQFCFNYLSSFDEAKQAIINLLQADPRSVYRRQKCSDRLYYFIVDSMHITCWFDDEIAEVVKIDTKRELKTS